MSTATILIVDDEPLVLELAERALARSGYDVLAVQSGPEALEILKQKRPIDLVLSDVVMPGMSGPELLKSVKQLSPSTAAVLMSGYLSADQIDAAVPFVRKPFSLPTLVGTVSRVLESCPPVRLKSRSAQPLTVTFPESCVLRPGSGRPLSALVVRARTGGIPRSSRGAGLVPG